MAMALLMPWEHFVCSQCYEENRFAVWLAKVQCLEPHRHQYSKNQCDHRLVVIDKQSMSLVEIRPLPASDCWPKGGQGPFTLCKGLPQCNKRNCPYSHSLPELDTWNVKQSLMKGNPKLAAELCAARLQPHSPSVVCLTCLTANETSVWQSWLQCVQLKNEHSTAPRITVVVNRKCNRLVPVAVMPPPSCKQLQDIALCSCPGPNRTNCKQHAKSEEELEYWKWRKAKDLCFGKVQSLYDKYSYPIEGFIVRDNSLKSGLLLHNYKSKFHKLVYLDELAHSRKMIQECDGEVKFDNVDCESGRVHLVGLTSAAIDRILHARQTKVILEVGGMFERAKVYTTTAVDRDPNQDALVVIMHSRSFWSDFTGLVEKQAIAHFEVNRQYFNKLHETLETVSTSSLSKIFPSKRSYSVRPKEVWVPLKSLHFPLDKEYQLWALRRILGSAAGVPYLLLGPFGTGKTHVLATAVALVLSEPSNRTLVCTHLNRGADLFCWTLKDHLRKGDYEFVLRLASNEETLSKLCLPSDTYSRTTRSISDDDIPYCGVIVTTFQTSLHLLSIPELKFTHILLDEGAQSPEPEAIAPLALASESTKIIIAGDNHQVGPQISVCSDFARENGLGTPLLERLFSHYKSLESSKSKNHHTSTLLTNYRCHPSILMLSSSLFYECALLSRSKSVPHPSAPYPLVFVCTSLQQSGFACLPDRCEKEADILLARAIEFLNSWPVTPGKEVAVGILASTKQQVACLRQKYKKYRYQMKSPFNKRVEILPTYNIQGEEFDAVFISTVEPTDSHQRPWDSVRSICNELVFNTVITRARSLVYSVGNPFLMQHLGTHYSRNCWSVYIQRCIQCSSLHLSDSCRDTPQLASVMEKLSDLVSATGTEDDSTILDLVPPDAVIERYIGDIMSRRDFQMSHKLVQDPRGNVAWKDVEVESGYESSDERENVVLCHIDCRSYRQAEAVPVDSSMPKVSIEGLNARRLAFHGDTVPVKVDGHGRGRVLLDEKTEKTLHETHYGATFLCRVDPKNPILFYPLDSRYPKFVNLPTLTRKENEGVVIFDPSSINDILKISNFIPMECAVKMLFIVKFVIWQKQFHFPLGVIVSALPCINSVSTQNRYLKVAHNILPTPQAKATTAVPVATRERDFETMFTIDPEHAQDLDDGLTCRLLTVSQERERKRYEFGVHITDVQRYVAKGSEVDTAAYKRGCSTYQSSKSVVASMLPSNLVQFASLLQGHSRNCFSVVCEVSVAKGGVHEVGMPSVLQSSVKSKAQLSYAEAQELMFCHAPDSQIISEKVRNYDQECCRSDGLVLRDKLCVLWKFALFLRRARLGNRAGSCFTIDEEETEHAPEAHFLIQELAIWANNCFAKKLLSSYPDRTILRSQAQPNEDDLKKLIEESGSCMSTSFSLHRMVEKHKASDFFPMMTQVISKIKYHLSKDRASEALHQIQFEHLHPQPSVANTGFKTVQCKSSYSVSSRTAPQPHASLNCRNYTHFTSPIRRYVDLVSQRLLYASLNGKPCPYTSNELKEVCNSVDVSVRNSNHFEQGMKDLELALRLLQCSEEHLAFIWTVEKGNIHFCYPDCSLTPPPKQAKSVHLKDLNGFQISASDSSGGGKFSASWKVKMCSLRCNPRTFLSTCDLELCKAPASLSRKAQIKLYVPDDEECFSSHLSARAFDVRINPFTQDIPAPVWEFFVHCAQKNPEDVNVKEMLSRLPAERIATPLVNALAMADGCCPMWIYTVHRPIQPCEVVKLQLSASLHNNHPATTVQLLEVAPMLNVCVQHNSSPSNCFVASLSTNASKPTYDSTVEYFELWEKVFLAEAAIASIVDCELLVIKDVTLSWPQLVKRVDPTGEVYYQVPKQEDLESGVCLKLKKPFIETSYNFFEFNTGDFVCLRCKLVDSDGKTSLCVLHMVTKFVKLEYTDRKKKFLNQATVFFKFIDNNASYFSPKVASLLMNCSSSSSFEIQLIPLNLPHRRVYKGLLKLRRKENCSDLAVDIALGKAAISSFKNKSIRDVLSVGDASISTSLWPLRKHRNGRGRMKLNKSQKRAVDLATNNRFVVIQGPPGTGKSVTGAHIAYALAMKLRTEKGKYSHPQLRPCVMYCGPSQQSVNVVLDILTAADSPARSVGVLRVFSRGVERKEFPGAKYDTEFYVSEKTETKCLPKHKPYALHHIIRNKCREISSMDREFEALQRRKKIPSEKMKREYNHLVTKAEMEVLKSIDFEIVLCTCNEASSFRISSSLKPVYCIIDECAMATEPECMVPICSAENVVLIGDHQQLQPVIQNTTAASKGLEYSLFERYAKGRQKQSVHMLQLQYRMHPEICRFPSDEFYERKLQTDFSVRARRRLSNLSSFWPKASRPFLFCNVVAKEDESHTGQKGSQRVGLESKFNVEEAKKIVQIANKLIVDHKLQPNSIAALTPYSAQREEIKKRLKHSIHVKTITESQGSEFDLVLLSTVRSKPLDAICSPSGERFSADIGWLRANLGFITNKHQINVGITRSKYGLVIVGNEALLSYDQTWRNLIGHYRRHGCFVKGSSFP